MGATCFETDAKQSTVGIASTEKTTRTEELQKEQRTVASLSAFLSLIQPFPVQAAREISFQIALLIDLDYYVARKSAE